MVPAFVYAAFFFTYAMKVVGASRDFLLRHANRVVLLILHDPFLRLSVGSDRPQATLYFWWCGDRAFRVRLLRHARYRDTRAHPVGDPGRVFFPQAEVGIPCGADGGGFYAAPALQRRVDRVSVRSGVCWGAGADDRDGAARLVGIGAGDRALHLRLCDRQHRSDGGPAEQPGSGFRARSPLRSRLERRRADDLPAVAPTDFGRSADPTAPRKTLRTRPGCSGTAHGRFRRWCASRYAARRAVPGSTEAQLRGQPA